MENHLSTLTQQLATVLQDKGMQLALAESCTGGGLAYQLTAVPGSSAWFERGFVTYSNAAKTECLGVLTDTLDQDGAVSEATAREMALGVLAHSHADVALSITGIAGPDGGSADKPVGTVWFGLARRDGECRAVMQLFEGNRDEVRLLAMTFALEFLLDQS